ncbi:MAG: tRNA 5'-guanylyltransferase [Nitrososphaerota archaeon]|jgi:tRNA(His) 5'-end guanylyltransferase|nr:tRNA 5'-guanylyltransferase [Nitrososphaerota archaeon]MDG6948861.1 tRNA 5'-guanylyltransferase [Nitrososphaerota archaeon]
MAKRSLDSIFRSWESSYVVEPMFLARLDGWHFRTFTRGLEKPFDRKLWEALQETAIRFFSVFRPAFAYAHSDEVTFVFTKATLFDRVEKLDSLMAGVYSSTVTSLMGRPAAFDCRVIGIARESNITAYLAWRQSDCNRNFVSGWAERVLADSGMSPARIAKTLKGMPGYKKELLCKDHGCDLNSLPGWQRRGALLFYEPYTKKGYNPITGETVDAKRRRVAVVDSLSFRSKEGKDLVHRLVAGD